MEKEKSIDNDKAERTAKKEIAEKIFSISLPIYYVFVGYVYNHFQTQLSVKEQSFLLIFGIVLCTILIVLNVYAIIAYAKQRE